MKPTRRVPFDKLIDLFINVSDSDYVLDPSIGEGTVRVYALEKGLQARLWDCTFSESLELYSSAKGGSPSAYFTVAYFLEAGSLQFADGGAPYRRHPLLDNLFLSASSDSRMCVMPGVRFHCLGISFSRAWLDGVLKGCSALENMKEQIFSSCDLSVHGTMSLAERALVVELISSPWSRQLGSFYIKTSVLKMISDFFYRLKEQDCFQGGRQLSTGAMLVQVENYLVHHITGPLPGLKTLAQRYSISEPTLKRLFKKRFGVSMSTYFLQKKMHYARRLLQENSLTLSEVARRVGYRSAHNFISMFRKHQVPALCREVLRPAS